MGWFDEQLKQRKLSDQEVFEDSFMQLAMAVTGGKNATGSNDKRYFSKQAIDEILQYYHKKPIEIPESITDFDEQLDYAFPMPSIPAMGKFWGETGAALNEIWHGADVQSTLDALNNKIRG